MSTTRSTICSNATEAVAHRMCEGSASFRDDTDAPNGEDFAQFGDRAVRPGRRRSRLALVSGAALAGFAALSVATLSLANPGQSPAEPAPGRGVELTLPAPASAHDHPLQPQQALLPPGDNTAPTGRAATQSNFDSFVTVPPPVDLDVFWDETVLALEVLDAEFEVLRYWIEDMAPGERAGWADFVAWFQYRRADLYDRLDTFETPVDREDDMAVRLFCNRVASDLAELEQALGTAMDKVNGSL